jgi:16S rRNA (guanine527-N7)-methyltransferase
MQVLSQHAVEYIGHKITTQQIGMLRLYEKELLSWNKKINLTAVVDPEMIEIKHFLDSISCLKVMQNTRCDKVIDVGTGAGFPGLPLKIINPSIHLTLVESIKKKAEFCKHLCETLKLNDVDIIQERIEAIGQSHLHREQYDWAIARAVAYLPTLIEYLLPLVKIGGSALAMKGENAINETHQSSHAIQICGGHLRKVELVNLPRVNENRYLVVIDKIVATPSQYPRRIGVPAKKPLI